jgi:hypothetical protein
MLDSCWTRAGHQRSVFGTRNGHSGPCWTQVGLVLDAVWTRLGLGLTYIFVQFCVYFLNIMLDSCWTHVGLVGLRRLFFVLKVRSGRKQPV